VNRGLRPQAASAMVANPSPSRSNPAPVSLPCVRREHTRSSRAVCSFPANGAILRRAARRRSMPAKHGSLLPPSRRGSMRAPAATLAARVMGSISKNERNAPLTGCDGPGFPLRGGAPFAGPPCLSFADRDQKSMPPPGIGGLGGLSLGNSATIASVVIKRPATDAAS